MLDPTTTESLNLTDELTSKYLEEQIRSPTTARFKNRMTRLRTDSEGMAEISAPIFHASLPDLSLFQFLLDRHLEPQKHNKMSKKLKIEEVLNILQQPVLE